MYYTSSKYVDEAINHFEKRKKDFNLPIIKIETDLVSGAIELNSLFSMTEGLQQTFTSAVNSIMGNGSSVGKIPNNIKEISKLAISEVEAGSFIIKLATIDQLRQEPTQLSFVNSEDEKLDVLENLLDQINKIDEEGFDNLKESFGNRTVVSSRNWFDSLAKNHVNFKYKKRNSNSKYTFTNNRIVSIVNELSNIVLEEETEIVTVYGRLVSYQLNNNRISLETDDREEINIKILDESLLNHEILTNSYYTLDVSRVEIIDNFDRVSYKYSIPTIEGTSLVI